MNARGGALLDVVVKPGSKSPGISVEDGIVVVRVRERAVEGAANAGVVAALSRALGVAASDVSIVRGQRARRKAVAVRGLTAHAARARLTA